MSKVVISSLIDEINLLLSRPVGSVSRRVSPDTIYQREQLKQLRSHLENLTDDAYLGNLEQQYQALIMSLQGQSDAQSANQFKTDKLETQPPLPPSLVSPSSNLMTNVFSAEPDLFKETSTMTNATPESNPMFISDRMIATLQQAIQQTLQEVVKESVQQSIQQVVSQTLAVERALMVGEISASLNQSISQGINQSINQGLSQIAEAQQRSQISQELASLNQQKQKLSDEIAKLESDRNNWMQQFQEFQNSQQESMQRSLQSVDQYVREQIVDTVQQTLQQTVQQTVQQTTQQVAQPTVIAQSTMTEAPSASAAYDAEFASRVQEQSDRFLAHLDEMFNSTFQSLEQDMQEYQNAIATKISYMETLEQKGEALINALVERISQQNEASLGNAASNAPSVILPELPADIPARYLETAQEPADENLISALLAGNEFGETIAVSDMETTIEAKPEVVLSDLSIPNLTSSRLIDVDQFDRLEPDAKSVAESVAESVSTSDLMPNLETVIEAIAVPADNLSIEKLLEAPTDSLFEESGDIAADVSTDSLFEESGDIAADPNPEQEIYLVDNTINPDFDLDAPTQLVENFGLYDQVEEGSPLDETVVASVDQVPLLPTVQPEPSQSVPIDMGLDSAEDPELLEWLDESSNRPKPTNIAEISPDEELLSWLGNEAIDMAKLPVKPPETSTPTAKSDSKSSIVTTSRLLSNKPNAIALDRNNLDDLDGKSEKSTDTISSPFFREFASDQADDSDESLILFVNDPDADNSDISNWEDTLFNELNSDLEQLDSGQGFDPLIAANIDQFIRNTPYSGINFEEDLSADPLQIVEIAAQTVNPDRPDSPVVSVEPSDALMNEQTNEQVAVPPIIENPDALFFDELNEAFTDRADIPAYQPHEESDAAIGLASAAMEDEMDVIFADVIAENMAKQSQVDPFETGDELDLLFKGDSVIAASVDTIVAPLEKFGAGDSLIIDDRADTILDLGLINEPINASINVPLSETANVTEVDLDNESDLETLLFGFDPATEIETERSPINSTKQGFEPASAGDSQLNTKDTFMQAMPDDGYEDISPEADTLKDFLAIDQLLQFPDASDTTLQPFGSHSIVDRIPDASPDIIPDIIPDVSPDTSPDTLVDATSFAAMEDMATILESAFEPAKTLPNVVAEDDDWTAALEQLEAKLSKEQNIVPTSPQPKPSSQVSELSADEFFASLEFEKLNDFADNVDKSRSTGQGLAAIADIADIGSTDSNDLDADDLLLNQFADTQTDNATDAGQSDWDSLLNDLSTFNFNQPLLDDRRQQIGLSAVAPISDISENVLDIDSLVIDAQRQALIPAPPAPERYSLDDTWILGVDFGCTAVRASLFNASTNQVYALSLGDREELSCQLAWMMAQQIDDPIAGNMRVISKKSRGFELETGEIAINQFKQFLKIGLPYRGVSAWQPILQWSEQQQLNLRWLIGALKTLIEQIQTRASHPKLPDLGLILLKLSGVVFGYPDHWSDAYILNVREAIIRAGLVKQPEQVLAVEEAIAPILSLAQSQNLSNQITLLMDAGALTTSFCLVKGAINPLDRSETSKLQVHSIDYAGNGINQDIVIHLFYPHWQLITNPHRHLCNLEHLSLPEVGAPALELRILLQQYLAGSEVGRQMLEFADRMKVAFSEDPSRDQWNDELMGHPLLVMRRELENLILQPFIKRLNRELNSILSNAGLLGEDVAQVRLLGGTMTIPSLSRWLSQKLPNAQIENLSKTAIANGLAVAPLYSQLYNVARQQYSDYFLLQEICRLNLTKPINPAQLLSQLQMRGVNIKACRDRILTILQGDLPNGLFPWQEPEQAVILEDPTLSSDLLAGRLFELETDGTYQPNVLKFQQLRIYLQAIISNMSQSLNEPLVFPEIIPN